MSSIAISGNTSGTGEFSLEAPETTADHNITLADASGNVVISDGTTITADYTNNRFSFGGTVVFNGLATNFNKWEILNANTSLVANKNYFANTQTTLTLTLPATANIGDTIRVSTRITERRESKTKPDRGIVWFQHAGMNQRDELICDCLRKGMMLKKPSRSSS